MTAEQFAKIRRLVDLKVALEASNETASLYNKKTSEAWEAFRECSKELAKEFAELLPEDSILSLDGKIYVFHRGAESCRITPMHFESDA